MEPYWRAFLTLHRRSRPEGFNGPRPLPLAEIEAYLNIRRIADPLERERFEEAIGELDDAYLAISAERIRKERAEAEQKRKRKRAPTQRRRRR